MPFDIDEEGIESIPFMNEKLFFSLPLSHPLANRKSISLKEMDGERMLLMSNVGFWNEMHKKQCQILNLSYKMIVLFFMIL